MNRIDGIIFDKDGTLFDFQATWGAWTRGFILDESGDDAELTAKLGNALGFDIASAAFHPDSPVISATTGEVADMVLSHLPGLTKAALLERMDARAMDLPQVEVAPLRPLLRALHDRGVKLGIATNDTEAPARAHLDKAGVTDLFDFIAGFDSGFGGKPAPGQLLAFASATGIAPENCAMVGDSLHDLHAARAAGMVAVGVLTGIADRTVLDGAADVVLGSIADLPSWLDDQRG